VPQAIWLTGYVLFSAVALMAAWEALRLFMRGDTDELNDRFGPQTLDEEIEAETELQMQPQPGEPAPAKQAPAAGVTA
jgi:hypothetical protein